MTITRQTGLNAARYDAAPLSSEGVSSEGSSVQRRAKRSSLVLRRAKTALAPLAALLLVIATLATAGVMLIGAALVLPAALLVQAMLGNTRSDRRRGWRAVTA